MTADVVHVNLDGGDGVEEGVSLGSADLDSALLNEAGNGGNVADGELDGEAAGNSDFLDGGGGSSNGEEAEGEDRGEDGTETHFELK